MTAKAQVKTQAKTPVAARIPQPPVAELEHEAERPDIAAQLEGAARLGHSLGAVGVDGAGPTIIQRQEIPEEEEEELQLKREPAAVQRQELPEEEEEELMMRPEEGRVGPQGGPVPPDVEAAIRRARGGGQPLEGVLLAQMSASLGHDFSRVRVHTDSEADALNRQLRAKGFTTGQDIFFRRGEYNPGLRSGLELIAHELTHVVQQSSGRVRGGGRDMTVRPGDDALEREAAVSGHFKGHMGVGVKPYLARLEVNWSKKRPGGLIAEHWLDVACDQALGNEGRDLDGAQQREAVRRSLCQRGSVARAGPNIVQRLIYTNVSQTFKTRSPEGERWDSEYRVTSQERFRYAPAKLREYNERQNRQTYDAGNWLVGFTTNNAANAIEAKVGYRADGLEIEDRGDWYKIIRKATGHHRWASKTIRWPRCYVFEVKDGANTIHYGHRAYASGIHPIDTREFEYWARGQAAAVIGRRRGLAFAPRTPSVA